MDNMKFSYRYVGRPLFGKDLEECVPQVSRHIYNRKPANRRPTSFDKATVLRLILSLTESAPAPVDTWRHERVRSGPSSNRRHDHIFLDNPRNRCDSNRKPASKSDVVLFVRCVSSPRLTVRRNRRTPSQLLKQRFPDQGMCH
jgi:hypothetical protein